MEVEVLRLFHRIGRDPRISTHCALVSRAFGASKMYYSGNKDKSLELSVSKTVENWGGSFSIEYVKSPMSLLKSKRKDGFKIVHLTMFGEGVKVKFDKMLIVVGSERVPIEFYKEANYNIAITNQPHSEVSSLGVFLSGLSLKGDFSGGKNKIVPQKFGKKVLRE